MRRVILSHQKNLMNRNLGHDGVLYAGRSSAELLQELLSRKVLRPVRLVGAMLQDGMQFKIYEVEHDFLGAYVKLSAVLTCTTSSRC